MLVRITDQRSQNKSIPLPGSANYSYQHNAALEPLVNTRSLPRPIPLQRSPVLRWLDTAIDRLRALHARRRAYRAARAEIRLAEWAERELTHLSPRTLQDIGAPQGLVGQRRWQDEQEAARVARVLDLRGW